MWNRILVVAAHPDDDILGCGGVISVFSRIESCEVRTIYLSNGVGSRDDTPDDAVEKRLDAMQKANEIVGVERAEVGLFEDQRFDQYPIIELTKWVEGFVDDFKPTTVFTHSAADLNCDHRCTHEAVVTVCRPVPGSSVKLLLFFEVASSTEWGESAFRPNVYLPVNLNAKMAALQCYTGELRNFPHSRSMTNITNKALLRGSEVGLPAREAFELGRMVL